MGRRSRSRDREKSKRAASESSSSDDDRREKRNRSSDSDRELKKEVKKEIKEELDSSEDERNRRRHQPKRRRNPSVSDDESPRHRRNQRRSRSRSNDRNDRDRRPPRGDVRDRDRRRRSRSGDRRRRSPDRNRRRSNSRGRDGGERRRRSRSREPPQIKREDGKNFGLEVKQSWGKPEEPKKDEAPVEKEKVNLGVSGKLMEDTNMFKGVVIKYSEPPEAKKPNARWRLYPFKGDESFPVMYIHRQSAYLVGRDHKIADLPVDHPSCSKQHAVIQYRSVPFEKPDGTKGRKILPYIIDLGSANGTILNDQKIDPQRYVELQEKDVLKFGFSTREYVVMKERDLSEDSPSSKVKTEQTSP